MTTAKKTVTANPVNDVIEDAIKHGDIVPSQATEKSNGVESNGQKASEGANKVYHEALTYRLEPGMVLEIGGVEYQIEATTAETDRTKAKILKLRGFEFVLVRPDDAEPTFLDKAKALVKNKKFYISAGATAVALAIGTAVIKLAANTSEEANADDNPNDQEVEDTTSA
jgi:hypothetical protein